MKKKQMPEKYRSAMAVAGCCMGTFWSGAIAFGYPGIMSTVWQEEFGVGSSETGLVVTIMLLAISVCTIFSGRYLNRFGIRACVLTGTVLMAAGMLLLMGAESIYMVYAWAFVENLGASFVYGPGLTTAQQWVPARRGLVSGLVNLTFGLSAAIMTPVWEYMLENTGYETVNLHLLLCIVVTNCIVLLLVRSPEGAVQKKGGKQTAAQPAFTGLTPLQALKTRKFRLLWLTWAFVGAAGISMVSFSKSYALQMGVSSVVVMMAFNLTNGGGRLLAGILCDVIGGELAGLLAFVIATVACFLLPHVHSLAGIAILAACVGYGFGSLFAVTSPIAAEQFGLRHFGSIFGLIFTGYGCLGGLIGPALCGVLLERSGGNYTAVFTLLAVFLLLGTVCMALFRRAPDAQPQDPLT